MTTTYRFHCRAIESDPTGYYYPRWDQATKLVVEAENRESAFRSVWAVMGEAPRGWTWAAQIDHIETVAACDCRKESDR